MKLSTGIKSSEQFADDLDTCPTKQWLRDGINALADILERDENMTDEELQKLAEDFADKNSIDEPDGSRPAIYFDLIRAFKAGYHAAKEEQKDL